jgi:hypothetical protein
LDVTPPGWSQSARCTEIGGQSDIHVGNDSLDPVPRRKDPFYCEGLILSAFSTIQTGKSVMIAEWSYKGDPQEHIHQIQIGNGFSQCQFFAHFQENNRLRTQLFSNQ